MVFFLLDKGHEAENLLKECLFLLHYHFPMEDSSEYFNIVFVIKTIHLFIQFSNLTYATVICKLEYKL